MMNNDNGQPNIRKVRQMMSEGGISEMMMQDKYEGPNGHTYSEAAMVADIINVMRLNTKQLGAIHDVDVSIKRMTEQRAAELLEQMARANDNPLVGVFEQIESKQDDVLQAVMGEGPYQEFLTQKEKACLSIPDELVGVPAEEVAAQAQTQAQPQPTDTDTDTDEAADDAEES